MTVPLPPPPAAPDPPEPWPTKAQTRLMIGILALTLAAIAYRVVYATGYQQTAALYIGVPAVLALGLAAAPHSRSATGMLVRGGLIGLLLAGIILPEGLICLVMAAPLVLLVAVAVGLSVDVTNRRQQQRRGPTLMVLALPLLLLSSEGVIGSPVDPHEQASATVVVAASGDRVAADLAATPRFAVAPTGILAFGFNRPVAATGQGLALGDERMIEFTGGTHDDHPLRLWGGTGEPSVDHHSHMVLRVTESRPGRVVFALVTDTTMLARWVRLAAAEVTWRPEPVPDRGPATSVTWTFHYERLIQPSWYFGPLERYGMDQAAGYLLAALVPEPVALDTGMNPTGGELAVRGAALYLPIVTVAALALWRRPDRRLVGAALVATVWNLVVLLGVHLLATALGWWRFSVDAAAVLGFPADLWIGWSLLWGAGAVLATTEHPVPLIAGLVAFDLIAMPAAAPVLTLGSWWWAGEAVAVLAALVPGWWLGWATARDEHLLARVTLQVIGFTGLLFGVIPAVVLAATAGSWAVALGRSRAELVVFAVLIAPVAATALQAVRELAVVGHGTPLPLDPPTRLVTTGPYAYLANPMQAGGTLLLAAWGVVLASGWVVLTAAVAATFSIGFAWWDEERDLTDRFGSDWAAYRRSVRVWWPRWRPLPSPDATVYVASGCDPCREVGGFLDRRGADELAVAAAEQCPLPDPPVRITFTDHAGRATGLAAIARSLEQVHLGWALVGFVVRLPLVRPVLQLIADAVGAGPRPIAHDRQA